MAIVFQTNVPLPTFTGTGFVPPTELAILAGIQADMNTAWGATLNFGTTVNPTPQGQLAISNAAILGDVYSQFCALANGVDPAFAIGRLQDAIARIYFLTRIAGASTVVQCLCIGDINTFIPPNSLAKDDAGNIYYAVSGGVIPASGNITLTFANQEAGPIPCPEGTLTTIYRTVPGWNTIGNPTDGELGTNVETRASFEARRQETVQQNTVGFVPSVRGALMGTNILTGAQNVPGILDAYVTDNDNNYEVAKTPVAVASASISGTTLTVSNVISGTIKIGQTVTGGDGLGIAVADGTIILSGSGVSWVVNNSQTVAITNMNFGGVVLPAHSLYVAVVGGADSAIAKQIWSKKSPGCPYYPGNKSYTVYDTDAQLPDPGVPYVVVWESPPNLPFVVVVNIPAGPDIPSDATTQVQNAVLAAFAGTDNFGLRVKIGFPVYANRFYAGINALGDWAKIISLFLGTPDAPTATVTGSMGANFTGTAAGSVLTASAVTGIISVGDTIAGVGIPLGTTIASLGTGTGGAGTYNTSQATTASAAAIVSSSTTLRVTAIASGALAPKQVLFDDGGTLIDGSTILSQASGSAGAVGNYILSGNQQHVVSETIYAVTADKTVVPVTIKEAPTITAPAVQVNYL